MSKERRGRADEERMARAIEDAKSARGGWSKAALAALGVSWPPPKGWKKKLIAAAATPTRDENAWRAYLALEQIEHADPAKPVKMEDFRAHFCVALPGLLPRVAEQMGAITTRVLGKIRDGDLKMLALQKAVEGWKP